MIISKEKIPFVGQKRKTKKFAILPVEIRKTDEDGEMVSIFVWLEYIYDIEIYGREFGDTLNTWNHMYYERIPKEENSKV